MELTTQLIQAIRAVTESGKADIYYDPTVDPSYDSLPSDRVNDVAAINADLHQKNLHALAEALKSELLEQATLKQATKEPTTRAAENVADLFGKEYEFLVTGGFTVNSNLKSMRDNKRDVSGFVLPDGRGVELIVALEVIDTRFDDGHGRIKYITSESEMEKLGFCNLDYDRLDFKATSDEVQEANEDEYVLA